MATRCLIGKENKDKTITYIYVHCDGYPSYTGRILLNNYKDEEKIDRLLELGDMSSLGTEPIGRQRNFTDYMTMTKEEIERYCEPYSLRGEDVPARTIENEEEYLSQDCWQEYSYLFRDGKWHIATTDGEFVEFRVD